MLEYILTFFKNVFSVLAEDAEHDHHNAISGEIDVVGHDYIDIELGVHEPKSYGAFFIDTVIMVPCNPHHHDFLMCELKNLKHLNHYGENFFVLRINWRVSGMRKIGWKIKI